MHHFPFDFTCEKERTQIAYYQRVWLICDAKHFWKEGFLRDY